MIEFVEKPIEMFIGKPNTVATTNIQFVLTICYLFVDVAQMRSSIAAHARGVHVIAVGLNPNSSVHIVAVRLRVPA